MDVSHYYQRSVNYELARNNGPVDLGTIVDEMRHEAQRDMLGEGFNLKTEQSGFSLDVRRWMFDVHYFFCSGQAMLNMRNWH